jgi:peptide subunit release factor RF-3
MSKIEKKRESVREKFVGLGFSFSAYAKSRKLDRVLLHRVVAGEFTGVRQTSKGKTRAIFDALRADKILE